MRGRLGSPSTSPATDRSRSSASRSRSRSVRASASRSDSAGLPAGSTWWARSAIRNPTAIAGGGATTIRATDGYSSRSRARSSTPSIPGSSTATTTSQAAPECSRARASAGDGQTKTRPSASDGNDPMAAGSPTSSTSRPTSPPIGRGPPSKKGSGTGLGRVPTMIAAYAEKLGLPDFLDGLVVGDYRDPEPPSGWVVADVKAASLNPHDTWTLKGQIGFPFEPPVVLGCDGAGLAPDGTEVVFYPVIPTEGGGLRM